MDDAITLRKKKLRLQAARRGLLEAELALVPFMAQDLDSLGPEELDELETLMAMEDMDLWEVLTGRRPAPAGVGPSLVARIRSRLPGSNRPDREKSGK